MASLLLLSFSVLFSLIGIWSSPVSTEPSRDGAYVECVGSDNRCTIDPYDNETCHVPPNFTTYGWWNIEDETKCRDSDYDHTGSGREVDGIPDPDSVLIPILCVVSLLIVVIGISLISYFSNNPPNIDPETSKRVIIQNYIFGAPVYKD